MAVEITRGDLTATQLRAAAGKSKDGRAARRMLAIALVLEGVERTRAAASCGMERQTLRGEPDQKTIQWIVFPANVHRYNAEGLERGGTCGARQPPLAGPAAAAVGGAESGAGGRGRGGA